MIFLITTDGGLETVVEQELGETDPRAIVTRRPHGAAGRLLVETDRVENLLRLTTIHHVIEVRLDERTETLAEVRRAVARASFPELAGAASFRVTSARTGERAPDRHAIERAAGAELQGRYGTRVDLEHPAIVIRVDRHHERSIGGVLLTRESLDRRIRRTEPLRTALKPTVAAAMIRLAGAHRGAGRLIDPMCGAATIPIEARRINPRLDVAAADWDAPTVELARRSIAEHGLEIPVTCADARALGDTAPGRFDWIVTDPPYGVRQARHTPIHRLYTSLLASFERAVSPEGRIVMIVLKHRTFLKALEPTTLRVLEELPVELGSLRPRLLVLGRRPPSVAD